MGTVWYNKDKKGKPERKGDIKMEKVFEVKNFSLCEKKGLYFVCESEKQISKSYRYLASAVKKFWELVR